MTPLPTCAEALALLASHMRSIPPPSGRLHLALDQAAGHVLATPVAADRDQPPFPRSTRDGYALLAASTATTASQRVLGSIRAGEAWTGPALRDGEALEIMTGAPLPAGADAIVMLEHVDREDDQIELHPGRTLKAGENIVPQGAEARAGETLLQSGTRIGPSEIALAASLGAARLAVYPRPRAAILSTGDELVDVTETPGPAQIRNSNSHGIAALVAAHGGTTKILPPAADTRSALDACLDLALHPDHPADILILSGGVSAGKYDLVEEALLARGARFFFTGVAIQPGKPVVFGKLPDTTRSRGPWIFGLPGNPVSTQVTALLFALPMLRALGGEPLPQPAFTGARLSEPVRVKPGLTRFLPARLESSLFQATVRPTGWQGSGDLNGNARANCYLVVPPEVESLNENDLVTVLLRTA